MNTRIKFLRKNSGLTQEKFAERIGLKQNSIALIESGKRNISDQTILSICREYVVDKVQCVDMFPNTEHVESVVLMQYCGK